MLNLNDIINVSFRKSNFSGYRTEDVDSFIDQVKDSYDQLLKKTMEQAEAYEALAVEKKELEKKLSVLAGKIEDYRLEESEIKNALVSAQKLGESSVREARHKAEIILKDANLKAERILGAAKADVVEQQRELDDLKKKVVEFRTKLLAIYKEHLTLIDAIPSRKEEFSHEEKPAASVLDTEQQQEEESVSEAQHYMPEEPVVHSDPEPEYTPVSEKDDFAVDAAVFDTEFPSHDLRYDVLKFDEVDESGV
ncbi:MAG: DivIVA domain-containing protein [Clostridium sp.]|uniref:DivIVA domain-containing protein n=1 Tax=Clostridium sp. TaxID=1506 RepID=UPI0029095F94|nr:DivIVA domain-containing protein [Clostridium sp.]MDU7337552.1 DivIVA domain-containing protein [Clostridium sp.]